MSRGAAYDLETVVRRIEAYATDFEREIQQAESDLARMEQKQVDARPDRVVAVRDYLEELRLAAQKSGGQIGNPDGPHTDAETKTLKLIAGLGTDLAGAILSLLNLDTPASGRDAQALRYRVETLRPKAERARQKAELLRSSGETRISSAELERFGALEYLK